MIKRNNQEEKNNNIENLENEGSPIESVEPLNEDELSEEEQILDVDETNETQSEEIVEETSDTEKKLIDSVNTYKQGYSKMFMINRWIGVGIAVVAVAVIVLVMIVWREALGDTWSIILVVITVVVMLGYNFGGKRILSGKSTTYIENYFKVLYEFYLDDPEIKGVTNEVKGKLPLEIIHESRSYLNIVHCASRNVTNFTYKDLPIHMSEVALSIQEKKGFAAVFVGKFIHSENTLEFPGRILVCIKGSSGLYTKPDDIEGMTVVSETNRMVIYSSYDKYKTILTKDILDKIAKFRVNKNLISAFISIKAGCTYIGLDLGNDVMDLPSDKKDFDLEGNREVKKYFKNSIEIISEINKKGK